MRAHAADPHDLHSLIAQLGSDDSQVRESAVHELMKLKGKDLMPLREAAIAQSPLLPAQIAGLHEAVTEIYLAALPYPVNPDGFGMIGLYWAFDDPTRAAKGITVDERIPGLPAYVSLKPGDVIQRFTDWPKIVVRHPEDLNAIIHRLSPGDAVRLDVVRDGRPIVVTVTIDYTPLSIDRLDVKAWIQDRDEKADAYWSSEFSVIDPAAGHMVSQATTSVQP